MDAHLFDRAIVCTRKLRRASHVRDTSGATGMPESIKPIETAKAILLVMDYQPGILANLPNGDEMVERMAGVIDLARSRNLTVGYVRVAFTEEDVAKISPRNKSFSRLISDPGAMSADDPQRNVHPRLTPQAGDVTVRKTRVGAFSTTDLAAQLAARGIDTLVLAGISTGGCVLSTIRDAADHDYRLLVLADCCADPKPEVHTFLIEQMFPRQADVLTSTELLGLLI
jgi:nicotinamidase-related amidase